MNLLRPQTPYHFRPPRYSTTFQPVLHQLARLALRYEFKVTEVSITGHETLTRLTREGHSILVAPNHSDHSDPSLLITVGRRCRVAFHFMATREAFERNRLHEWVLQRAGAFSVNREGADLASIRMAIRVLQEGRFPLVIFPEGEIYHHMEVLDELNEGVASIALRASMKLRKGCRGYLIPTAIRLRHDPSLAESFSDRLTALETRILLKPRLREPPIVRIAGLAATLLAIKEEEFLGAARRGTLPERIQHLRNTIMQEVEQWHDMANEHLSFPKRMKLLRSHIRKELTGENGEPAAERAEELYDHLDRIFVVQQLYSYPETYLLRNPSIDRVAEIIFKLEEDVLGKGCYHGKRRAEVHFDTPIDIKQFLQENRLDAKTGIVPLTRLIQQRIQGLLNR